MREGHQSSAGNSRKIAGELENRNGPRRGEVRAESGDTRRSERGRIVIKGEDKTTTTP